MSFEIDRGHDSSEERRRRILLNDLTTAAMDDAAPAIGYGPVTMVNLLWFRDAPGHEPGFAEAKPDVRSAYYEGYAGTFVAVAKELGVEG